MESATAHRPLTRSQNPGPIRQGAPDLCTVKIDRLARAAVRKLAARAERALGAFDDSTEPCPAPSKPTAQGIDQLVDALLERTPDRAIDRVHAILARDGCRMRLAQWYLAPAAAEMGRRWAADRLSFSDVTYGVSQIQGILRDLPRTHPRRVMPHLPGVIFAAPPGEFHTLGASIAADHFRVAGWDVGLLIGISLTELRDRIECDDRDLVVLTGSGRHSLTSLAATVTGLRGLSRPLRIYLAGPVVKDANLIAALPPVDGLIGSLDEAESLLSGRAS